MLDGLLGRGFASKWFVLWSLSLYFYSYAYNIFVSLFFPFKKKIVFNMIDFFYSKSLIKLVKNRIDVIRRKRNATQKFLKKDIADLLSNGLDINAYGRVIIYWFFFFNLHVIFFFSQKKKVKFLRSRIFSSSWMSWDLRFVDFFFSWFCIDLRCECCWVDAFAMWWNRPTVY